MKYLIPILIGGAIIIVGGLVWYFVSSSSPPPVSANIQITRNTPQATENDKNLSKLQAEMLVINTQMNQQTKSYCIFPNNKRVPTTTPWTCAMGSGTDIYFLPAQTRIIEQYAYQSKYPTAATIRQNDLHPDPLFYTRYTNFLVDVVKAGRGSTLWTIIEVYIQYLHVELDAYYSPDMTASPTVSKIYHDAESELGFQFR